MRAPRSHLLFCLLMIIRPCVTVWVCVGFIVSIKIENLFRKKGDNLQILKDLRQFSMTVFVSYYKGWWAAPDTQAVIWTWVRWGGRWRGQNMHHITQHGGRNKTWGGNWLIFLIFNIKTWCWVASGDHQDQEWTNTARHHNNTMTLYKESQSSGPPYFRHRLLFWLS